MPTRDPRSRRESISRSDPSCTTLDATAGDVVMTPFSRK
jgi:hypothetical protein